MKIISENLRQNLLKAIDWSKNIDQMIFNSPYDVFYFFEGGPAYNNSFIECSLFLANSQLVKEPSFTSFERPIDDSYLQYKITGDSIEELIKSSDLAYEACELTDTSHPLASWRTNSNESLDWLSHSRGLDQGELGILAFKDKNFAKEFVSLLPEGAFCDQNNLEEHWGWLSIGYGLYSLHPERHWDEPGMDKIISKEQAMILLASDKYKE